jgi:hypothetical protein
MKFTPNLVIGVVITLVGIVLMLDRLGLVELGQALRLWPILVTVFGVSVVAQALQSDKDGKPVDGRPIISPGLVFFICIVGILAWRTEGRSFVRSGDPVDPQVSLVGIMGRDDRVSLSNAFSGAEMTTIMGRTRLDLRKATLKTDGEVVVDVFGMMGAVEVIVPETWAVDSQAWAVMGGVEDKRRRSQSPDDRNDRDQEKSTDASKLQPEPMQPTPAAPGATSATTPQPRLVIKGMVMMGALVIRS